MFFIRLLLLFLNPSCLKKFNVMKYLNNPFNIRHSSGQSFVGEIDPADGFCRFSNVGYSVRAAILILKSYRRRKVVSISDIISTWAPPSENPTSSYVSFVCNELIVNRSTVIDISRPLLLYNFLRALCKFETGYTLSYDDFDSVYISTVFGFTDDLFLE